MALTMKKHKALQKAKTLLLVTIYYIFQMLLNSVPQCQQEKEDAHFSVAFLYLIIALTCTKVCSFISVKAIIYFSVLPYTSTFKPI